MNGPEIWKHDTDEFQGSRCCCQCLVIKLEIQHHNLKNCQHGSTVKSPEAQNSAWGGRPLLCGFSHHKKNGETLDRNRWVAWFKVTSEIAIDSLLNRLSFALSWRFLFHLFICALFVLGVVVWSSMACLLPRAQGYSQHKCGPSQVPEDPALRVSFQHSRWSTHSNYQTKVLCPSQGKGSEARYFLFPWLEVPTHSGCMHPKVLQSQSRMREIGAEWETCSQSPRAQWSVLSRAWQ